MCLGHGVNKRIELVDGVPYICRNEGSLEVSGLDALRLSDGFGDPFSGEFESRRQR